MARISFDGSNSTLFLTGCSNGIGKAVAERAKQSGFTVVGIDKVKPADGLVDTFVEGDLSNISGIQGVIENLNRAVSFEAGRSYYLVNNAGMQDTQHNVLDMPDNTTNQIFHVCMFAPFELSKWFVNQIKTLANKQQDASIVNIGSIQAVSGIYGNQSPYNVAKNAVHGITRTFADAAAQQGLDLRVNTLHPGTIQTLGMGINSSAWAQLIARMCPQGRSGRPEEVAESIIALLLETYTNSSQRTIDGGMAERPVRLETYPFRKFDPGVDPNADLMHIYTQPSHQY